VNYILYIIVFVFLQVARREGQERADLLDGEGGGGEEEDVGLWNSFARCKILYMYSLALTPLEILCSRICYI